MQTLNQDQKDALQEIANIGMGQAGAAIAHVFDEFIRLSVPRVVVTPPGELVPALAPTIGCERMSAVRQAFHGSLFGEAIAVYGEQRCNDLADLMGYEHDLDHAAEVELLLDVSNILIGACVGGIAEQLQASVGFSPPALLADHVPLEKLLRVGEVPWRTALLVEVNFSLERRSFACHLIILMSEDEIRAVVEALDRFLEAC